MTKLIAKSVYSPSAKAYTIRLFDGDKLVRTLPCLDESGRVALDRADRINKTGRDPYGYFVQ